MPVRRIATRSLAFWERFAPWASPTWLAKHFPPRVGGKNYSGWQYITREYQTLYPDLPWLVLHKGERPSIPDGPIPEPIYEDELEEAGLPVSAAKDPGTYKESTEILEDGTQRSDRLLEMSAEQSKSVTFLLEAHGFDVTTWELVSAKNNIWNVYSKRADGEGHDVSTLYSSKITVRPLVGGFDIDAIMEAVRSIAAVKVDAPSHGAGMLEVNNTDMHLGNSTFEWYRPNLERTIERIGAREWAEIVVPVGSDLFHTDNFKNTTSNGTLQSSVDWPAAWADATRYFAAIVEAALAHSLAVYLYYIIGNHDESMAWAFCQMLAARYPQVTFDLDIEERKVHTFGSVAIGMTHGDNRTRKDLDRIFMAEFPCFASATVREVHAGHYHHELTRDEYGVVVRSLSTAARTDKWHREEGYVGACKRFTLFEYEPDALTGIHYV